MCGRFTVKATWAELVALYRLTMDAPPHNLRPRYNVCPTDPVDVVTAAEGKRELLTMRWGLVPWWWSKRLNELRMATFNARAETVEAIEPFRKDLLVVHVDEPTAMLTAKALKAARPKM